MTSYQNELSEVEKLRERVAQAEMAIPSSNEPSELSVTSGTLKFADSTYDPNILVTSGPQQTVTLPPSNQWYGNVTVTNTSTGNIGYNSTVVNIDLDQPTSEMLDYLREQLEDRVTKLKNQLSRISDEYEEVENDLHKFTSRLNEIDAAIKLLEQSGVTEDE